MDDFDYSVHISDQDWDSFFRECEECNLLPPVLANMEDSGMSDMDEIAGHKARVRPESGVPDPELPTHSPDHVESPVDLYLSRYGATSPLHVLSGSEDDSHMETVNVFFERLKSVSASEDYLKQKHSSAVESRTARPLKRSDAEIHVDTQATETNESMQKDRSYTHGYDELAVGTHIFPCPDTEIVTKAKACLPDECKDVKIKSSIGKALCCALVNGKDLIRPNQEEEINSQLVIISDSGSKELLVCQGQTSSLTPRRRRKKKKRMCSDPLEPDHGRVLHFKSKQSESDDDVFLQRSVMEKEICPSADCSSGTGAELASATQIFSPPSELGSILGSFPIYKQSVPENVMEPTVAESDSPKPKFSSAITAAQNLKRLDFLHEKSDLTGKPASAGQFALPVNLSAAETGGPVKKAEPLMLQSDDGPSAPTNGDNVRSHLQLNSNLPSGIKCTLKGSAEVLPPYLTTCDEVKAISQTARKPGCSEIPLLRYSREFDEDCKSPVHESNSQENKEALLALLPSNPAVCSQAPSSPYVHSQAGEFLTSSDSQCGAAFQGKTSASDNISCAIFCETPQASSENLLEPHTDAQIRQNLGCVSHKDIKQSLAETVRSTSATQSDPPNMEEAQTCLESVQRNGNVYGIHKKVTEHPSPETKAEVKSCVGMVVMSNEAVRSRDPSHSENELQNEEIPPCSRSNDLKDLLGNLKGLRLEEAVIQSPAAEDRNEGLFLKEQIRKHQLLIQITDPEGLHKENSQPSDTSPTTDNEEKSLANSLSPHCSSETHGVSPCAIPEDMTSVPESKAGTQHVSFNINTIEDDGNNDVHYLPPHSPAKDPEVSLSTDLASPIPESIHGITQTFLNNMIPGDEGICEVCHVPPMSIDEAEQTSLNGMTNVGEGKCELHHAPPQCPSKDYGLPLSAITQGITFPVPESVDGAENCSTMTLHLQSGQTVKQIFPSLRSEDITSSPASKNGKDRKTVSQDRNEGVSLKENLNLSMTSTLALIPDSICGAEQTSLNIMTSGDEGKVKGHHVSHHCPVNPELPSSAITECATSLIPESMDKAEQIPSNISTIGGEEKCEVHHASLQDPKITPRSEDHGLPLSAIEQVKRSAISDSVDGPEPVSSNINTIGNNGNGKVLYLPPHCPAKDPEVSLTTGRASPIPESIRGMAQTFLNNMIPGDEGKCEVHHVPPQCPFKDQELPLSAKTQGMSSPILESVDGAKTLETLQNHTTYLPSQNGKTVEEIAPSLTSEEGNSLPASENGKDRTTAEIQSLAFHERLSLKENIRTCNPFIQITGPESKLEDFEGNNCVHGEEEKVHSLPPNCPPSNDHELSSSVLMPVVESPQSVDGAEVTASNFTTGVEEKPEVHDVQTHSLLTEHEVLPSEAMDGDPSPNHVTPSPALESEDKAVKAERERTRPAFAISSFWNEMEKLTINDILQLHLVGQAQHPSVLLQPEEGIADVLDTADSGYFTHLDDAKPDRSSGDMSFISDFDEELAQLHTQEAARSREGSPESPNSETLMWESELDLAGTGSGMEEMLRLSSETAISPPLYRENAQQCFRKLCKNISVQNLQALEGQPFRKILRNASLLSLHSVQSTHSIHPEDEDDYIDPFDRVEASTPVCLSDDEEESPGITFSEIIQYLFGEDEPERCASAADNITASYLDGTGTSVPETYDHFFSEFEGGSFFNPLADDPSTSTNELVPIFDCSRSGNKNLQFPEVYDYFFPDDSPAHSDEDEEFDYTSIQVITRHDHMAAKSHDELATLDTSETSWNFLRNNPLSFRRVRRTGFTAPPEESSSWALTPVNNRGRSFQRGIQPINAMGPEEKPFQDPLLVGLENHIFKQLVNQQKIQQELQTAVADPRRDAPLMPLKQADMCLVCIAFASWVLKSANPQGADMWKAALLANISALSAIRYLRRCMKDEATRKTPLRQIEPA